MGGGLLNIVSYGNLNIIINGNPQKVYFWQLIKNIQILGYKSILSIVILQLQN